MRHAFERVAEGPVETDRASPAIVPVRAVALQRRRHPARRHADDREALRRMAADLHITEPFRVRVRVVERIRLRASRSPFPLPAHAVGHLEARDHRGTLKPQAHAHVVRQLALPGPVASWHWHLEPSAGALQRHAVREALVVVQLPELARHLCAKLEEGPALLGLPQPLGPVEALRRLQERAAHGAGVARATHGRHGVARFERSPHRRAGGSSLDGSAGGRACAVHVVLPRLRGLPGIQLRRLGDLRSRAGHGGVPVHPVHRGLGRLGVLTVGASTSDDAVRRSTIRRRLLLQQRIVLRPRAHPTGGRTGALQEPIPQPHTGARQLLY
mmetsp:Transcript_73325/g.189160  ORF Transcript_73325/g.189160 Transcript_73325/m.189160 type:complete len:328 (+) Transcript_73325:3-986(+)